MTHAYQTVENGLYGYKGLIKDALSLDSKHQAEVEGDYHNKLIWIYPMDRPPHDPWTEKRKVMDRVTGGFQIIYRIYTNYTQSRYRAYTPPNDIIERIQEHKENVSYESVAGRGQTASPRGWRIIAEFGKRGSCTDVRLVRDIYIN